MRFAHHMLRYIKCFGTYLPQNRVANRLNCKPFYGNMRLYYFGLYVLSDYMVMGALQYFDMDRLELPAQIYFSKNESTDLLIPKGQVIKL